MQFSFKRTGIIFLQILIFYCVGFSQTAANNKSAQIYKSETDDFSVWFPSTPSIENKVSSNGLEIRAYKANTSQIVTEVSVIDLEQVKYTAQMKTRIFNGIRDEVKRTLGMKVLLDKEIIRSGQRGRQFKFVGNNGFGVVVVHQLDFIRGFKLYQVKIGLDLNSQETASVKKFQDSFKFLEKSEKEAKYRTVKNNESSIQK